MTPYCAIHSGKLLSFADAFHTQSLGPLHPSRISAHERIMSAEILAPVGLPTAISAHLDENARR